MQNNDLHNELPLIEVTWEAQGELEPVEYHLQHIDWADETCDSADFLDLVEVIDLATVAADRLEVLS